MAGGNDGRQRAEALNQVMRVSAITIFFFLEVALVIMMKYHIKQVLKDITISPLLLYSEKKGEKWKDCKFQTVLSKITQVRDKAISLLLSLCSFCFLILFQL
jgi:hypothetical protein